MRKRLLSICLILMLLVVLSTTFFACKDQTEYEKNLLVNSDFETKSEVSSSVSNWVASNTSVVIYPANVKDDDYDVNLEKRYVKFTDTTGGYSYIAQNVKLQKNSIYRISAYIKVDTIVEKESVGFRFGFDTPAGFDGLIITDQTDGFVNVEYYFTSATNEEVKFVAGIGSPKVTTTGDVKVDNIKLEKVKQIPDSYLQDNPNIEVLKYDKDFYLTSAGSIVFVVLVTLASALLFVVLFVLIKVSKKSPINIEYDAANASVKDKIKRVLTSNFAYFVYVILGAFVIRFLITVLSFGMTSNIESLQDYSMFAAEKGLLSVYSNDAALTLPMGGAVIYSLLGYLAQAMSIKEFSLGYTILMRMPLIIADVVAVYLIYSFTAKHKDERQAAVYSSIYAFIPLFFFSSSFAAQLDVIAAVFLIASMIQILNKNYGLCSIYYMCALLFSHYALVILPVILIFEVYGIIFDEEKRWSIAIYMLASFIVFFIVAMFVTFDSFKTGDIFEYFKRILAYFKNNAYLTQDTFNIYAIFGTNAVKQRTTLVEVLNWLFVAGVAIIPGYIYFKNKNRSDLVLFAGIEFVLFAIFGACATVNILILGLAILVVYLIIVQDKKFFAAFASLASLGFLNIALIASQSGFISNIEGAEYRSFIAKSPELIIFSILTVAAAAYLVYVAMDISYSDQLSEITPFEDSIKNEVKKLFKGKKKISNRKTA